jgi:hypothetical protein
MPNICLFYYYNLQNKRSLKYYADAAVYSALYKLLTISTMVTGWQKSAIQRKSGLAGNFWHKLTLQMAGKMHVNNNCSGKDQNERGFRKK